MDDDLRAGLAGRIVAGARVRAGSRDGGARDCDVFRESAGLLSARCVNDGTYHYLEASIDADPADPRTDDIRGDVLLDGQVNAPWGLHPIDMTLAMGNLDDIVGMQAETCAGR